MRNPGHRTSGPRRTGPSVVATLSILIVLTACSSGTAATQAPPSAPTAATPSAPIAPTAAATPSAPTGSPGLPAASRSPVPSATSKVSPVVPHDFEKAPPMKPEAPLKLLWQTGDPAQPGAQLWIPTVDPTGRIWVASSPDNQFWIFSPSGKLLEKWGTPGKGSGQFDFGSFGGIAFGPDGSFWVADTGNVRVDKFDGNRKFVTSWGGFGTADGQFAKPTGIGIDQLGNVFVNDETRQDIQEFDANGTYIRTFAKGVAGPWMAVLQNGWVFTDLLPDGTPGFTTYKPDGTRGGTLDLSNLAQFPTGIAVDEDHTYIAAETSAEPANPQVLMELGGAGIAHVWPNGGEGIALDPHGGAIYMTFSTWPYLRKYELPKP
jgi:hypothetical protein